MRQYCFKDIYWVLDNNQSIIIPFIFNTDQSKIKLLENESIITITEKDDDIEWTSYYIKQLAANKIAQLSNIDPKSITVYDSASLIWGKLYNKLLNPEGCDTLKQLAEDIYITNSTNQRNVVKRFVENKLVSYNDLKPIIYSLLNLSNNNEIIDYTHNQTTNF